MSEPSLTDLLLEGVSLVSELSAELNKARAHLAEAQKREAEALGLLGIRRHPVIEEVIGELQRATVKFPTWPTDPLHALAVLGEEFGELTKAMLQLTYEPHKAARDDVRGEAIQTAAMAMRLALSLDVYAYKKAPQHQQ